MSKKSNLKKENKIEKLFKDTKEEHFFRLINGCELKNIHQLAQEIGEMSDDAYYYHASENRNDFSSWVQDVFGEHELAEDMRRNWGRLESQACVLKHLVNRLRE